MVSTNPGTMDTGVIDARRRANNPLTRNQRRKNKKPRKANPPTAQVTPPKALVNQAPATGKLTPNVGLDERVERMRQPGVPLIRQDAISDSEQAVPNFFQEIPDLKNLDRHTRTQMIGFAIRAMLQNPDLLKEIT